jgi:hypothetical protein
MRTCIDCGRIIPATDKRCAEHARPGNSSTATTTERGYGAAHQRRAKAAIAAHPWCEECGATEDLTAHHVIPLATAVIRSASCASSAGLATADEGRYPRGDGVASKATRPPSDPANYPREKPRPRHFRPGKKNRGHTLGRGARLLREPPRPVDFPPCGARRSRFARFPPVETALPSRRAITYGRSGTALIVRHCSLRQRATSRWNELPPEQPSDDGAATSGLNGNNWLF